MSGGRRVAVGELRDWAYPRLARAPYPTPALDFRALLGAALSGTATRAAAMGRGDTIGWRAGRWVRRAARRRERGTPIAYLVGRKEFYGLSFVVNGATLTPRPESELLVEHACRLAAARGWRRLHDCGCGCGNIAIAIRYHSRLALPDMRVSASDISGRALRVARRNCRLLLGAEGDIVWRQGSLLAPLVAEGREVKRKAKRDAGVREADAGGMVDGIVANLPYVRRDELGEPSIRREPRRALDGGGREGTSIIRALIGQAAQLLSERGALLIECAPRQIDSLRACAVRHGLVCAATHTDMAGRERMMVIERAGHQPVGV